MSYNTQLPAISDLKKRARKRMPKFAFDYVDAGIDDEAGKTRNRSDWQTVMLTPRYLKDASEAKLHTTIFGKTYAMPFGAPPVGLGNMMWPGAELALARASQEANIPYILSTLSTTDLVEISKAAGDVCWFQLYVPNDIEVMEDLLSRVSTAKYNVLVVTLDIPVGAKRNRELKNGLKLPFSMSPDIIWQSITHPAWALQTLKAGKPDFVNVLKYKTNPDQGLADFFTSFSMKGVTKERLEKIRELWDGPLVLKGVQYEQDMQTALDIGCDGVIVSNHGGRQLDAAPSSMQSLKDLAHYQDKGMTIMVDSGIRTGLDVVRSKALGSQMAFSGRSFFWGIGAMGTDGPKQVIEIYRDEIGRTLQQIGCESFAELDGSWLT